MMVRLILGLEGLFFIAAIGVIIYLIVKRYGKEKDFEERDN